MSEHKLVDNKEKVRQSRRVDVQKTKPVPQDLMAWDIASYMTSETTFNSPIQTHADLLCLAPSAELRARIARELQQTYGNQYVQRLVRTIEMQEKPSVGAVDSTTEAQVQRQDKPDKETKPIHPAKGIGKRRRQFEQGHKGIDIAMDRGTPIVAVLDGRVILIEKGCKEGDFSCGPGYGGNCVALIHKERNPRTTTKYYHLSAVSVKYDNIVKQGDEIGQSGNTGNSNGPHLHFVWEEDYRAINPRDRIESL